MKRYLFLIPIVSLFVAHGAAGDASAAVSCTYNSTSHIVAVTLSATGDEVSVGRTGGGSDRISVTGASCGDATVLNTDTIQIVDVSGGSTSVRIGLFEGQLAPGRVAEPGSSSEIEVNVALGSGFDFFEVMAGEAGSDVVFGADGVNLNADQESAAGSGADADVGLLGVEAFRAFGRDGPDRFSGAGGTGTGAPFQAQLAAVGHGGADVLIGGDGVDILAGSDGDDEIRGGNGNDSLLGEAGDDTLDGQAGSDRADYDEAPGPVHVDLATGGAQATGEGADTLTSVEELTGSDFDDTLTGDAGPNTLTGGNGEDTLAGADGDDTLNGGNHNDTLEGGAGSDTLNGTGKDKFNFDSDTASYESSPAAVSVDLSQSGPQDTGGAGIDVLNGVDNLAGTFFDDRLTGDARDNQLSGNLGGDTLVGGDGVDRLEGGLGDDHLRSADAFADDDICGGGTDDVARDLLDLLNSDCETLLDSPVPGPSEPSGGSSSSDTSEPSGGTSSSGTPEPSGTTSSGSASTPPILRLLRPRPNPFRAARRGPSIARHGGTRVRYTVSTAATTSFRVERAAPGRRQGRRCVRPTASNRTARTCKRWVRVRGHFIHKGVAGLNRFRFSGRIGGRTLRPGAYRLVAVAGDASGASSAPARARLRIRR